MNESERLARDYRVAADTLDERPLEATRAAILAAGARRVRAAPRDAAEPIAPGARARSRWPFAAAAAVLLSTLAVMMAVRTEKEMPSFTKPATGIEEDTAKPDAAAAADQTVIENARPGRSHEKLDKRARSVTEAANAPSAIAPAPVKQAQPARAVVPRASSNEGKVVGPRTEPADKGEVGALRARAVPPAPPTAVSAEVERPPVARADSAKSENGPAEVAGGERRRNEVAESASGREPLHQAAGAAGAAAKTRSVADAAGTDELRAEDWLEKIIKLRKAGRQDEADAELKRFREHYPQVQIPADALSPSGTR